MSPTCLYIATTRTDDAQGYAWTVLGDAGPVATGAGSSRAASSYELELRAAVEGLAAAPEGPILVVATPTLKQVATEWIPAWRAAGWRKRKGRIGHLALVKTLADLLDRREVAFEPRDKTDPVLARTIAAAREAAEAAPVDAPVDTPPEAPPSRHPLVAYTDGGCRGNPGVGGWGFLLIHTRTGTALAKRGGDPDTTNNRMETLAAIEALDSLTADGQDVEIRTDSTYLRNMATRWMAAWKQRGWRKKDGEPVKNLDLVQRLDALLARHRVTWSWVKGHAGEPGNEYVDALTNAAMDDVARGGDGAWSQRFETSPVRVPRA